MGRKTRTKSIQILCKLINNTLSHLIVIQFHYFQSDLAQRNYYYEPQQQPQQFSQAIVPPARPTPPRMYSKPQQQSKSVNVVYSDDDKSLPTQSRSFKVLQKLTEGIEDELQNLHLQEQLLHQQLPGYDEGWQKTNPRQLNQPHSSSQLPQGYRTISTSNYKQFKNEPCKSFISLNSPSISFSLLLLIFRL